MKDSEDQLFMQAIDTEYLTVVCLDILKPFSDQQIQENLKRQRLFLDAAHKKDLKQLPYKYDKK